MGCTLDDVPEAAPLTIGAPAPEGVRAIAFDLDSTLVDIIRLKERAAEAAAWAMADAGLDVQPDDVAGKLMAIAYEIGIDHEGIVEEYLRRFAAGAGPDLVSVGRHAFELAEDQNVVAYPRVHRTLLELARRGYRLALITDAPRRRALRRLQAARLLPFFSELITGDDTPQGKADARPYRLAADRLGVTPGEMLMVGDNPARDIGVARAFGCRTVLARYGLQAVFHSDAPEHEADADVEWLDELLALAPARGDDLAALERASDGSPNVRLDAEAHHDALPSLRIMMRRQAKRALGHESPKVSALSWSSCRG